LGALILGDYRELHRPQFHFTAAENWINDPNGLVYHEGVWHLFFQHNIEAPIWGKMWWGHAVSNDLIHWQQVEHALYPDEMGSMFSGSAVVDHENSAGFGAGASCSIPLQARTQSRYAHFANVWRSVWMAARHLPSLTKTRSSTG
jgi:sucrose-6-phosphate hydrolase SacC (GH32 family)